MGNILGEVNRPSDSVKAYRNFLRLYSRQHAEMHPNDAANVAIRLWGTLTPSEKQRYEELDWDVIENATKVEGKSKNSEKKKSSLAARKSPKKKSHLRKKAGKPKPSLSSKSRAMSKAKPNPCVKTKAKAKATPCKTRRVQAKKTSTRQDTQRANKLAFVNFIKKFREATCLPNKKGRKDSLKKAAKAWCNLRESQRRKFYTMPRIG